MGTQVNPPCPLEVQREVTATLKAEAVLKPCVSEPTWERKRLPGRSNQRIGGRGAFGALWNLYSSSSRSLEVENSHKGVNNTPVSPQNSRGEYSGMLRVMLQVVATSAVLTKIPFATQKWKWQSRESGFRKGINAEAMEECCLLAFSICFLIQLRVTCPGVAPPTMSRALPH